MPRRRSRKPQNAPSRPRYLVRGMAALATTFLVSLSIVSYLSNCPVDARICAVIGVVLWIVLPIAIAAAFALPRIQLRLLIANGVCTSAGWSLAVAFAAAYVATDGAAAVFLPMFVFMFVPLAGIVAAGAMYVSVRGALAGKTGTSAPRGS